MKRFSFVLTRVSSIATAEPAESRIQGLFLLLLLLLSSRLFHVLLNPQ